MFVALARDRGCAVTVVGRGSLRLEAARALGAMTVIDVAVAIIVAIVSGGNISMDRLEELRRGRG